MTRDDDSPTEANSFNPLKPLIIIAAVVSITLVSGTGIYLLWRQTSQLIIPPSSTPTPSFIVNQDTTNWAIYQNNLSGYIILYPRDFKLLEEVSGRSVSFYREGVTNPKYGGQGRGYGMAIYTRTYGSEHIESQSRPTESVFMANYPALRWTDNPPYVEDIWLMQPSKRRSVRITISTFSEDPPYDKIDFAIFQSMLETFKFTK